MMGQLFLRSYAEIYIQSAHNNSNDTYTFMCLGSTKTASNMKSIQATTYTIQCMWQGISLKGNKNNP